MNLFRSILLLLFFFAAHGAEILANIPADTTQVPVRWMLNNRVMEFPSEIGRIASSDTVTSRQIEYIYSYMASAGYFSADVDSVYTDNESGARILSTSSGCRFSIEPFELVYEPEKPDSPSEYQPFLRAGSPYSADDVEFEINRIIRFWENRGYMLVRVEVEKISPESGNCTVGLQLRIVPGPELHVGGQLHSSLERNNPDYIKRASGVRNGMLITPNLLRNARLNLENTGLFDSVAIPEIVLLDDEYHLYYELEETRTNHIDVLVGYVPQATGGHTVVGTGQLLIRNAILDGSHLDIAFERLQQLVTKLDFSYDARWIMGTPFGAGVHFNFLQQDSTYQVRNFGLRGRYTLSATTDIIGTLRQESASSNTGPNIPVRVLDSDAYFAGVGVEFRQTDNHRNPTRGLQASLLAETGVKRITDNRAADYTDIRRLTQQEIRASLKAYISPFRRQVIAPSLHGYLMISEIFTENDLNRFGGAQSLRGYREDQFQASGMVWGDVEYRYLLDRRSYAFVFGAAGYYERPELITEGQTPLNVKEWLTSYGFGFMYDTPIGIMKFTYAVSPEEDLANGKVHVGIVARF